MQLSGPSVHSEDITVVGMAANAVPLIKINYEQVAEREARWQAQRIQLTKERNVQS
jgi:hypothetical protein